MTDPIPAGHDMLGDRMTDLHLSAIRRRLTDPPPPLGRYGCVDGLPSGAAWDLLRETERARRAEDVLHAELQRLRGAADPLYCRGVNWWADSDRYDPWRCPGYMTTCVDGEQTVHQCAASQDHDSDHCCLFGHRWPQQPVRERRRRWLPRRR